MKITMKKALLLNVLLGLSVTAMANDTVSVGYSHGKVSNGDTLNGVNAKYRSEINNDWGWLASVNYMKGDSSLGDRSIDPDILGNIKRDTKYYSVMAGPTYRVNENISVYGMAGWAHTKAEGSADWLNHESGKYIKRGSVKSTHTKNTLGYGLGVQINPVKNIAIDVGYEGAQSSNAIDSKGMNSFNVGVGYKF